MCWRTRGRGVILGLRLSASVKAVARSRNGHESSVSIYPRRLSAPWGQVDYCSVVPTVTNGDLGEQ
jgi:hypothetical protein